MPRKRPRRRSERRRREAWIGAMLIGGVGLAFAALGAGYYAVTTGRPSLDEAFCPVDVPPAAVLAVLIDQSDPITPVQQLAVRQRLEDLRDSLPRRGRIEIYTVGPTTDGARKPVMRICNPGSPETVDAWTESVARARRRWEESFRAPLTEIFDEVMPADDRDSSPIMESIQSVAASAMTGRDLQKVPRTLIVVSDMLQHSGGYSHYRNSIDYTGFRDSAAGTALSADLRGVEVRVLWVMRPRDRDLQTTDLVRFWQHYFAESGATLTNVVKIFG